MSASLILWATSLGFGLGGVLCGVMVILIRTGRFSRNAWLGVHTEVLTHSDESWRRAHLAAAPWLIVTSVGAMSAALLGGLALAFGAETPAGASLGIGSILVGLVGVGAGTWRALVAANRAGSGLVDRRG